MPVREILRAVVFLHRIADDQDFTETINCVPDSTMKELEAGLLERQTAGEIDMVQIGRHRYDATSFTDYSDQVGDFLARVDEVRLHSSMDRATPSEGEDPGSIPGVASRFTGFDDIPDR